MTVIVSPPTGAEAAGELAERVFGSALATLDIACIHLGQRLGLYEALSTVEPRTAHEIAARANTDERYTREWLEQQAATGIVACEDPSAKPLRFTLPEGHDLALLDPHSLASVGGFVRATIGALSALNHVIAAFPTGAGVPYADYGTDMREGIAEANLPKYTHHLGDWLRAIPDVHERLQQPDAHVADLACGIGHSTRAIARAYPLAHVDGFDDDAASIDRANARTGSHALLRPGCLGPVAQRQLRPRDDLPGRPRHEPPGRGARDRAQAAGARRRADRRRREGPARLQRAERGPRWSASPTASASCTACPSAASPTTPPPPAP
jgi:hypothetical protein